VPEGEIGEEHRRGLEAARSIRDEDVDLVLAAPDRKAAAALQELAELRQQLRDVDPYQNGRNPPVD